MVVDLCFGSTGLRVVPVVGMLTMRVVQSVETSLRPTVALVHAWPNASPGAIYVFDLSFIRGRSMRWLRDGLFPLLVGPDAFLLAVMQPETGQPAAPRHPPPV